MTIVDDTIVWDLIILEIDNSALYIKKTDYDINDLEYCIINATPSMTPTMLPPTYPSIFLSLRTNRPTVIPTKLASISPSSMQQMYQLHNPLWRLIILPICQRFLIMILIWQWMMDC